MASWARDKGRGSSDFGHFTLARACRTPRPSRRGRTPERPPAARPPVPGAAPLRPQPDGRWRRSRQARLPGRPAAAAPRVARRRLGVRDLAARSLEAEVDADGGLVLAEQEPDEASCSVWWRGPAVRHGVGYGPRRGATGWRRSMPAFVIVEIEIHDPVAYERSSCSRRHRSASTAAAT